MRTCCCCGKAYNTKNEDILIYGCRNCHLGFWQKNQEELKKVEIMTKEWSTKDNYPYGKASLVALEASRLNAEDKVATLIPLEAI